MAHIARLRAAPAACGSGGFTTRLRSSVRRVLSQQCLLVRLLVLRVRRGLVTHKRREGARVRDVITLPPVPPLGRVEVSGLTEALGWWWLEGRTQ